MEPERQCPKCGRKIPWGQIKCPFCPGHGGYLWSLRRDSFLLLTIGLLILLFAVTGFAVRTYHDVEKGYAQEWYARGEEDLRMGRALAALADFRTALSYSHDNSRYQLRLAQTLMMPGIPAAAGSEARIYLLNLLEHEPGNGTVNLELARLAARDHAVPDALRYYHGAIYGEWVDNSVDQRRAARLELVEFLLDSRQKDSARSELIALATDLPPDPALQTKVGMLLIQVNGCDDGLKLFHQALLEDPHSPAALAGAGECHFENGEYPQAEHDLARAIALDPHLTQAEARLGTVRSILENDPSTRGLGNSERARRAVIDFNAALGRLRDCAGHQGIDLEAGGGDVFHKLYAHAMELQPQVEQQYLSRDSDQLSQTMDAAFDIEQATAHTCGDPQGIDLAILLMSHERAGARP